MSGRSLKAMGREWAEIAIRNHVEPATTGNLEHDRECAQHFLRMTGAPPKWYEPDRHGLIYERDSPRAWKPKS
jgi:hypothetical protein